jgi:hypothetical protein
MSELLKGEINMPTKVFKLPLEIIDIIKTYTGEGIWRNGKFITIHKISKSDNRYKMLLKRPRIKQVHNCDMKNPLKGCVWFKTTSGKFIVINVMINYSFRVGDMYHRADLWEMHYNKEVTQIVIR